MKKTIEIKIEANKAVNILKELDETIKDKTEKLYLVRALCDNAYFAVLPNDELLLKDTMKDYRRIFNGFGKDGGDGIGKKQLDIIASDLDIWKDNNQGIYLFNLLNEDRIIKVSIC